MTAAALGRMETVDIAARLGGGDPRSLGRVEDVIEAVLGDPAQLDALFACLFCEDAVVRMRQRRRCRSYICQISS